MPELLTKHPEIVLEILKDTNVKCGTNVKPKILITCPPEQFCTLPKGELCIYGVQQNTAMTQFNTLDRMQIGFGSGITIGLLIIIFLLGYGFAMMINSSKK